MSIGSSNPIPFKRFQFRWREKLGNPQHPYLIRTTLILFGYSIRLHHWLKSDDNRFFHDHGCDFISIILKGSYFNVVPLSRDDLDVKRCRRIQVRAFRPWFNKAAKSHHYLSIPKGGAWTLLLCGRLYHKWGFYVNGHKWRPLRYFHKYGIIQQESYQ